MLLRRYGGQLGTSQHLQVEKELAEAELKCQLDKDYLPVDGLKQFTTASAQLLLGDGYESIKNKVTSLAKGEYNVHAFCRFV